MRASIAVFLVLVAGITTASETQWSYTESDADRAGRPYSVAIGTAFNYQYDHDFSVSFQCTRGRVRFAIDVDMMMEFPRKQFPLVYRVDDRKKVYVSLRTFSNEDKGGYTYIDVRRIAKQMLMGDVMRLRVATFIGNYVDARLTLNGSDGPLRRVFLDCGESLDGPIQAPAPRYSRNRLAP